MTVHLLVLIHGMWGNPAHLAEMSRIIQETKGTVEASAAADGTELDVLLAQNNRDQSTYDGIDWCAERAADEVDARVRELEDQGMKVSKISIAGYSLGGLVARYLVGILFQRNFFMSVEPINFTTFATPHIGLVRYKTTFSWLMHTIGPSMLSRTGEQFFARDKWGITQRSLLEVMADPKEIFYQALTRFEHVHVYGNAVNDLTVPYVTALFEQHDPFANRAKTGMEVEFDPKYNPVLTSYRIPDVPPVIEGPRIFSREWFASKKPSRFLPPPLANLKFPLNTVVILLLPVLVPTVIFLVLGRFTLHTRSSRARIRLLEHSAKTGRREMITLVDAFSRLEREIEGAVVEIAEDDLGADDERTVVALSPSPTAKSNISGEASPKPDKTANGEANHDREVNGHTKLDPTGPKHHETSERSDDEDDDSDVIDAFESAPPTGPQLTDRQRLMARALSALPRLTKHLVFLDPMRNSHATIIARDVQGFSFHKRGWGVLQHWADGFVL